MSALMPLSGVKRTSRTYEYAPSLSLTSARAAAWPSAASAPYIGRLLRSHRPIHRPSRKARPGKVHRDRDEAVVPPQIRHRVAHRIGDEHAALARRQHAVRRVLHGGRDVDAFAIEKRAEGVERSPMQADGERAIMGAGA